MNSMNLTKLFSLALILTLVSTAHAGEFKQKHPRRVEVNQKVRRENREITRNEKSGQITADQAKADRANLKTIKQTERAEVKANGGHLTRDEKINLNQDLRNNQNQINGQKVNPAPSAAASLPH